MHFLAMQSQWIQTRHWPYRSVVRELEIQSQIEATLMSRPAVSLCFSQLVVVLISLIVPTSKVASSLEIFLGHQLQLRLSSRAS